MRSFNRKIVSRHREMKKNKWLEVPKATPIHSFPVPVPMSYGQLRRIRRKFWTPPEIEQIIKLQEYVQERELNIRSHDFTRLWSESRGRCAITGHEFGTTDEFDVGIDQYDPNGRMKFSNLRLVLLPLSYNRIRANSTVFVGNNLYQNELQIASAILYEIENIIVCSKSSKNLPITLTFKKNQFQSNSLMLEVDVNMYQVPYVNKLGSRHKGLAIFVCRVEINDNAQEIVFVGKHPYPRVEKYGASDLTIRTSIYDFNQKTIESFIKLYEQSLKRTLIDSSIKIIEDWKYGLET